MPRFHFTVTSARGRTECGAMDLPSAKLAIPEALQIGMGILRRDDSPSRDGERWSIDVSDDGGRPVYRFQMRLPIGAGRADGSC